MSPKILDFSVVMKILHCFMESPSNWSLEALIAENPFALFNSVFHFFDFNSDFLHSCLLWYKITISGVSSFWSRWRDAMTTGFSISYKYNMNKELATD